MDKTTVIVFSDGDPSAFILTSNKDWLARLDKLSERYPERVSYLLRGEELAELTIPSSWLKVRTPMVLSDSERERRRESYIENCLRPAWEKRRKKSTITA